MQKELLLRVENLKKYFPVGKKIIRRQQQLVYAVDDVSFDLNRGETLGLVGESGCGKTTCGRTIIRLYEPDGGHIYYDGRDIAPLSEKQLRQYRKKMQIIFQDPYASLDPRMVVMDLVSEGMKSLEGQSKQGRRDSVLELLGKVGLSKEHAGRFPHEFSGGQRQRIAIARALAVSPEFIVCDEPISALDVSIQAQIINMLEALQSEMGLTYLFIAHDISMVKHISDRIGVMYLGKLVELAPSNELYYHPVHPYTQALLSAVPIPDPQKSKERKQIILEGDVPSPINVPEGCRFAGRCRYVMPKCHEKQPELKEVSPGHFSACYLNDQ